MIVADVFIIKNRGPVVTMAIEAEVPASGIVLRRTSDGKVWPIRGVERFCIYLERPTLGVGERVGILLPDDADVVPGDVVEIVPATNEETPPPREG